MSGDVAGGIITEPLPVVPSAATPPSSEPHTRPGPTAPPPYLAAPQGPSPTRFPHGSGVPSRGGNGAVWAILALLGVGAAAMVTMLGGFPAVVVETAPSSTAAPDTAHTRTASPSPSIGPATLPMPQLLGLTIAQAREELKLAGLAAGAISLQDGPHPASQVLNTIPVYGAIVSPTTPIAITVASGQNKVPAGLQGQTAQAAQIAVTAAGFAVQYYEQETSGTLPGLVLTVTPGEGAAVPLATIVTLVVSTAPREPQPTASPSATAGTTATPQPRNSTPAPTAGADPASPGPRATPTATGQAR